MDDSLIMLSPTDNMFMVKSILFHDDIWSRFSDGVKTEDYEPDNNDRTQWLIIYYDQEIAGVIRVFCETTCAIQFHPYMIKPYRKYVREMTEAFFHWFIDEIPRSILKINVMTPDCYKSVINATKKMGFTQEGINRDSYRKDGIVYNQTMSGITRKEVERWVV